MKNNTLGMLLGSIFVYITLVAGASATSLGLSTESPIVESSFALVDYFEFGADGDLSAFGAEVDFVDGVSPVGLSEIGFGLGFSLAGPTAGATGGFDVFDQNGLFLAGDLAAVGFVDDIIELQYTNLSGSAAGDFGSSVLAIVAFDDALGTNPFDALVDGQSYVASISISRVVPAVSVPAPGTLWLILPLVLGGRGLFRALRQRS